MLVGVAGRANAHTIEQRETLSGIHFDRGVQTRERKDLLSSHTSGAPALSEQQPAIGSPVHDRALSPACRSKENRRLREVFQGASDAEIDAQALLCREINGRMHLGRRRSRQADLGAWLQ